MPSDYFNLRHLTSSAGPVLSRPFTYYLRLQRPSTQRTRGPFCSTASRCARTQIVRVDPESYARCIPVLSRVLGPSSARLRSLDLFASPDLDAKEYNLLLGLLGHNLEILTLALSRSQTVSGHVDLSSLPVLETLHLVVNFPYKDPDDATFNEEFLTTIWPSMSTIIATASPSLRRLNISLQLQLDWRSLSRFRFPPFEFSHVCEKLTRLDWTALERAIASRDVLEEIHVGFKRFDWHNEEVAGTEAAEAERVIRDDCLKSPHARSLLRFSVENRVPDFPFEIAR